jgi:hypothetical protein
MAVANICNSFSADYSSSALFGFIGDINIERVLADSGYYDRNFIVKLEEDKVEYVISVPIHHFFQRIVYQQYEWTRVDDGIEVSEFRYSY